MIRVGIRIQSEPLLLFVTPSHKLYPCTTNWSPLFSSLFCWNSPGGKKFKWLLLSQEHQCLSKCPLLTPPAPRLKPIQKPFTPGTAPEVSTLHSANNAMSWTSPPLTPHFTHTSFSHIHMNTETERDWESKKECTISLNTSIDVRHKLIKEQYSIFLFCTPPYQA